MFRNPHIRTVRFEWIVQGGTSKTYRRTLVVGTDLPDRPGDEAESGEVDDVIYEVTQWAKDNGVDFLDIRVIGAGGI